MSAIDQNELDTLVEDVARVRAYRDVLVQQVSSLESEETGRRYRADLYQKCTEVFKQWLEDSLEKNIQSMAELGTTALRHVIHDQELLFKIQQDPKLNRLSMKFLIEQDGVEGDPMASFGGGAVVLLSMVLRLAVMARMGMVNMLLLDESMMALANRYVPSAADFMRRLSEETGVNILMVTHNPEYLAHAHVAYECHKDGSLKLRRMRTVG